MSKAARKKARKRAKAEAKAARPAAVVGVAADTADMSKAARKKARKRAKAEAKAAQRERRQGGAADGVGSRPCGKCAREVDLLIRCQVDATKAWWMVCGRCWKTKEIANGVVDGDGSNPHYKYGGLWKNRK